MKGIKLLSGFLLLALFFGACEEIPPYINYEEDQFIAKDTTYVLSVVPAKQPKNVLIEDVSGVRCVNCPDANALAASIMEANPGRVSVITIHPTSIKSLTFPIEDTFNTDDGENIFQQLIGGSPQGGLPVGAINRRLFAPDETDVGLSDKKWQKYTSDELGLEADVNLIAEIVSVVGRTVTVKAVVTFTDTLSTPAYLSLALTESHIINPQESSSGRIEDYEHNHVLRDMITPYQGALLADEVLEAGRVYERIITFDVDTKFEIENCEIMLCVNRFGANNEVLQSLHLGLE